MNVLSDWDDEYAKLARGASQLRSTGGGGNGAIGRENQIATLRTNLDGLLSKLSLLEQRGGSSSIPRSEMDRRRNLIRHLQSQLSTGGGGGGYTSFSGDSGQNQQPRSQMQQQSVATMAMKQQDGMIDELALGVSRLKDQSHMIGDEAKLHVRLIDDMDNDVDKAREGMEAETRRAQKLSEDRSVWKLYVIIGGLSILLVLLILAGLT